MLLSDCTIWIVKKWNLSIVKIAFVWLFAIDIKQVLLY